MSAGLAVPRSRLPVAGGIAAGGLTILGNGLGAIVYPWLVYDLTGSFAWMGVIAALALAPMVIGTLFGSVLVDRYGTRPLALIGDSMSAATAIAIALAASLDELSVELLAGLVFFGALLDGPAIIAHEARLPEIARVARLSLSRVNIIDDLVDNAAGIAAPAFAGLLITLLSVGSALWVIAGVALLGAVVTILAMPRFKPRTGRYGSVIAAALDGPRFIAHTPVLRNSLTLATLGMGVFIALENVILPAILRGANRPATDLGLFLGVAGAGAVAINLALAALKKAPALRPVFIAAFVGLTASVGVLAFDQSIAALAAAGALLGVSAGPLTPVFNTMLQTVAPKPIRARVLGASTGLILTAAPFATLAAGFGLEALGGTALMLSAVGVLAACTLGAIATRSLASRPTTRRTGARSVTAE